MCKCFIRSKNLSGETEVFEVYKDAWIKSGAKHDYVIGLQPDNPDRKLNLDKVIDYVKENNLDDFFTVDANGKKKWRDKNF